MSTLRSGQPRSSQRSQPPRCDRAMRHSAVARLMLPWHCERAANGGSRSEMSATAKSRDDDAMQNFVIQLANDRR